MPIAPELLDLMTQSVTIALPDGTYTDRGAVNYAAGTAYTARIVEKNQLVRAADGAERVASMSIWLSTTTVITPAAKLTLPVGYTPNNPPIMAVERFPDEDGAHHTVLRVGARSRGVA